MERTILDYLNLIKKRLWLVVLFVLISCATTYYVSKNVVVPEYRASGQLLVNASTPVAGNSLNDLNFSLNLIESYKDILLSPTIMKAVVDAHPEFGLTEGELAGKIELKTSEKSQVINLSVTDESYPTAAGIVNAVSQTFIRSLPALMKMDNVTFLTPADPQANPAPATGGYAMNLVISFVVSLMAALAVILLMESLNQTLRTEKEAEALLGLPVIGSIPVIRGRDVGSAGSKARVGEGAYATVE
ncbi:capsular biosynthesis protein [Paenibacillus spiritus]|uniref:Capsular biosynthesis protein n=1 Tax=Paenibacillus spiritus TaxID=2496557 RepID=A0A5J5G9B9_9BACL|nr:MULTISPECIES: Wzz/FepE/Etk N-terminal domain-containing protein [Paenibacillus]KAA9004685.1 capsular biosynthesis protein [Paenibacillus spiritus]